MNATSIDCPLCTVTVIGQGPDDATAAEAATDALEEHLNHHRQENA